jgi:hypothetical protein
MHYSTTTPDGGKTSLTAVGTNATRLAAGGFSADGVNQSESVKHAGDTMLGVTKLKGYFGLGNTAVRELGDVTDQLIK